MGTTTRSAVREALEWYVAVCGKGFGIGVSERAALSFPNGHLDYFGSSYLQGLAGSILRPLAREMHYYQVKGHENNTLPR